MPALAVRPTSRRYSLFKRRGMRFVPRPVCRVVPARPHAMMTPYGLPTTMTSVQYTTTATKAVTRATLTAENRQRRQNSYPKAKHLIRATVRTGAIHLRTLTDHLVTSSFGVLRHYRAPPRRGRSQTRRQVQFMPVS